MAIKQEEITLSRVVLVGDIHVSDRPPANATETYTDDICDMLKWVAQFAELRSAQAVIWAGDVFHHKAPGRNSHELVLKMIDVVREHERRGVPLWCVTGNHDVMNGRVEDVRARQPLGVLFEAGLRELNGWHPELPVFGIPWRETWTEAGDVVKAFAGWVGEDSENERSAQVRLDPPDLANSLVVTHAPIYPPSTADRQLFELVDTTDIANAMGNRGSLYYGHIHEYHGVFTVAGVTFANPGAISRGSLHEYNLERSIKVCEWDSEGHDGAAFFTEVDVPHKPAAEVFRLEEAVEAKESRLSLEEFLADVGTHTLDISSTGSVVEHLRTRQDITPRVRDLAIEIVEQVG